MRLLNKQGRLLGIAFVLALTASAGLALADDVRWNLDVQPSPGHTGNILIRPDGQLHEGPGNAGDRNAAYHFHRLDLGTGRLDARGEPVSKEGLDDLGKPAVPKRGGLKGRDLEDLAQEWRACLGGDNPFSQDCRNTWNDFVRAVERQIERLEQQCAKAPKSSACEQLRRILAAYLHMLEERLERLEALYNEKCKNPKGALKAWCEELAREIEELREKTRATAKELQGLAMSDDVLGKLVQGWSDPIDDSVERALLSERWSEVAAKLTRKEEALLSPIARLIVGHAYLATNKNNESLLLLSSVSLRPELKAWKAWTARLVQDHQDSPVAHYLHGDALARLEQWDQALQVFGGALKLRAAHAMALNARGAVYCAVEEWDSALVDLTTATLADKNLADAYASLGAMWVQRRAAPAGALRAFERALELSPDFVLARNGKGCAEYALGHWEQANTDIGQAGKKLLDTESRARLIIDHNLKVLTFASKRAQFPFFAKFDFTDWSSVRELISDPSSILHPYFRDTPVPDDVNDPVVNRFNEILEIPGFYDRHKTEFDRLVAEQGSEEVAEEIGKLISGTGKLRSQAFAELNEDQKQEIRKLNRLLIELLLPTQIIQLAMAGIDSPGMSIERGVGLVNSWQHKQTLPTSQLLGGIDRMQNIYMPVARALQGIPFVGPAIGGNLAAYNLNQIKINQGILNSRQVPMTPSGGVDYNMRRAHVDEGDWGVGTWFGLAYHVEPKKRDLTKSGS